MIKSKFKKLMPIILMISLAMINSGAYSKNMPCSVKLEFDSNSKGSVANYVLSLQLKNTSGRAVSGASVIYMDETDKQLGNTLLFCSANAQGLAEAVKPGSYGHCEAVLQKVDGAFMRAFGSEKWTQIVNTQLASLNAVSVCNVLGFAY